MYDKTPVYPHLQHLAWAHEPLKSIYVFQRLLTTVLLVPFWVIYYAILPRSFRPRPSWSITQIVIVKFTKRVSKVTEVAGVTWGTRDPTQEPDEQSLKETRFAWVPPLPAELYTGIVNDLQVTPQKVGTFIWPKHPPASARLRGIVTSGDVGLSSEHLEAGGADSPLPLIGLYLHGGGYCHMSAHEKSGTSRIPRRLMEDKLFREIHAVEYRLLQHAPMPGALQDAAAVYAHLVTNQLGARKCPDGKYPEVEHQHAESIEGHGNQRELIEPFISGNDDPSHAPVGPVHLTHANPDPITAAHRPRVILIGDSAGGNLVLALARWIRDEGVLPGPDGMLLLSPSCDPSHTLPQVPASRRPRPHADTDYLLDTPEPRALLSRTFLGHHPVEMVYSPYISPASEWVLSAFHGQEGLEDLEPFGPHEDSRDYRDECIKTYDCPVSGIRTCPNGHSPTTNPYIRLPRGMGLFTDFPRALVVVGDAERLEREVAALERALEHDGVRVRMVWAKDAVHDVLIMAAWDERVREGIWKEIGRWVHEIAAE
ncbi:alpha/beta-hydrolase [Russula earlei]|uniref:Alpha/beta-hydrolase n=1 Tax=Russula earlei TaxID=71964 RepID=A0ACC0UCE8_9AGAM|nr:alpha/beta-hydrolase [Russula earlei]